MEQEHNINVTDEKNAVNEEPATQSEIKQPEVPIIDYSILSTEEIIRQLQDLVENYPVNAIKEIMDSIPDIFNSRYKSEYEAALATFTEAGNDAQDFKYTTDVRERFNSICKNYREKRHALMRQLEAEKENNLQLKQAVIEDLKALVQKEEAMDKTFQEFREIQERWRNIGPVPQAQMSELLETYHHHVENFYNYIKINKELRDLDLKRNLDAKTALCEEAEKLENDNDITGSFKQLQLLHARWKEIGPIPKDLKETLWERFKAASTKINDKHHNFFESLKEEQENNLKIKEDLCEKAAAIAAVSYTTMAQWQTATQQILELQQNWKASGNVPQKDRASIYKKFRTICDNFFDTKRAFHAQMDAEMTKNLELKIALCEKVEAIQDSTDWKTTTDRIISYQKEWKKIGPAPRKYSNKVWARFRAACDVFFNNKSEHFKGKDEEQEKNLELKKALIEEARTFVLSGDTEKDIEQLKEFQNRWNKIGFVPIKSKDAIQEEFRGIINQFFNQLNLTEFDRNLEQFRAKISTLDTDENKDFKIVNEREKLVNKIRQLETDINTWENNIGFIAKSNKSQGLLKELESKIGKTKQRLELLQEKLKALDEMI